MCPAPLIPQPDHPDLRLVRIDDRLTLLQADRDAPIWVDFLGGATAQRIAAIRRRDHPLARAVGRRQPLPTILDGTAGLGRDAFVLAALGYHVTGWERSPVLHSLLADGLARLLADPSGRQSVADRFRVELGDCRDALRHDPPPAVVYLDPMFPERHKSAKVRKEMQLFQKLLGSGDDSGADALELLEAARAVATDRVVLKRPAWATRLATPTSYEVAGSKVRWDVYLC